MAEGEFRVGDRVEYVGPDYGPNSGMPRPGERGTVDDLSPYDNIVTWDAAGPITGSLAGYPVRRVEDDSPRETGTR